MQTKDSRVIQDIHTKNSIIGENLKTLRKEAGLSQPELAALLDVTFQQIQKYEKGRNRLPVTHLHFLKSYFDVPYEAFFYGLAHVPDYLDSDAAFRIRHKLARIEDTDMIIKVERIIEILTS